MDGLLINGEATTLKPGLTMQQLLEELGYDLREGRFIVAVNGSLVPVGEWAEHRLNPGDQIDILGAITGG
ncbi:sulfur carrier protein ThiS [uncultured Thalassolituus sp.]|uniref:sulfur carrier protein ThiS n=1 Tax=uncultured Thalassolituus sp. TaxID=285273 RepID=UPI0026385509|nr:sulfur carrier protein ThiS [uncultured Thalassolituus sp.]